MTKIGATSWQNQQNDCAPSKDSDQPRHPPNLIRVFAIRMKKAWVLSYPMSAQRRLWSGWVDDQADLSLRWAHSHFAGFVVRLLFNIVLALELTPRSLCHQTTIKWAPSSEFVSSSIPSWQISTAHAQPFRGARDLAVCLKVPLDSLLIWASSEGSGETAWMRRLAWTFAARIGDKYQIRLTRSRCCFKTGIKMWAHIIKDHKLWLSQKEHK